MEPTSLVDAAGWGTVATTPGALRAGVKVMWCSSESRRVARMAQAVAVLNTQQGRQQ